MVMLPIGLLLSSCSRNVTVDEVSLVFASTAPVAPTNDTNGFNCDGSIVLRCGALEETEQGLIIQTSKAKSMKANHLIFIKTENLTTKSEIVASVPIVGKEYEYDMSQVKLYDVETESLRYVIDSYGIMFSDWQTGTVNELEKFPCCE